jgi:hypothetical protein
MHLPMNLSDSLIDATDITLVPDGFLLVSQRHFSPAFTSHFAYQTPLSFSLRRDLTKLGLQRLFSQLRALQITV